MSSDGHQGAGRRIAVFEVADVLPQNAPVHVDGRPPWHGSYAPDVLNCLSSIAEREQGREQPAAHLVSAAAGAVQHPGRRLVERASGRAGGLLLGKPHLQAGLVEHQLPHLRRPEPAALCLLSA
ncbi:hypothetical protein GTZ78_12160 [Streptomyces sp. SID8361]|nr:hypothetical protein [Streptomyces sp. SID8361]